MPCFPFTILPVLLLTAGIAAAADGHSLRALTDLVASRDALHRLLTERAVAAGPMTEVQLWPEDAFRHHLIVRYEPLSRFAPVWETPRLRLLRRGGAWSGPELGWVTSRFHEMFHPTGVDASGLQADAGGVSGELVLSASRKDVRYEIPCSTEGCDTGLPEFNMIGTGSTRGEWDVWFLPRERVREQSQRLTFTARERRGWILDARLLRTDQRGVRVWAWIEDGRIQRGWGCNLNGGLPVLHEVSASGFSLKDGRLKVDLSVLMGSDPWMPLRKVEQRFAWECPAPGSQGGGFACNVWSTGDEGSYSCTVTGVLAQAFAGTVDSSGIDAFTGRGLLAGVVIRSEMPAPLPAVDPSAAKDADLLEDGCTLYRQIHALDQALRDPLVAWPDALRDLDTAADDHWRYYPNGGMFMATPRQEGVNRPLIRGLAAWSGGVPMYLASLARAARAAVEDRTRNRGVLTGAVLAEGDPTFGPYTASAQVPLPRTPDGGNLLAAVPPATGAQQWAQIDDWLCAGFLRRSTSFERLPNLPEIAIPNLPAPGFIPESGEARLPMQDPSDRIWFWRGRLAAPWNRIGVPREAVRVESRWRHHDPPGFSFVGDYGNHATWYATTRLTTSVAMRVWMAADISWDGRLWVNDRLVWRPSLEHSSHRVAVFPVELEAGVNRLTVCASPLRLGVGNAGNFNSYAFKYGERTFGSFGIWVATAGSPQRSVAAPDGAKPIPPVRGARGDGSGRYPDADPPLAWDLDKGTNVAWKVSLPTDDAEPVVVGDALYLPTYRGEVVCLDAATGAERWRSKPTIAVSQDPWVTVIPDLPTLDPLAIWNRSGRPEAPVEAMVQAGQWKASLPALARQCLPLVAAGDRLFYHDPRGVVAAFDQQGRLQWETAVPLQRPRVVSGHYGKTRLVPLTPPALHRDRLIVAAGSGLMALDPASGKTIWTRDRVGSWAGQFSLMRLDDRPQGRLVILGSGEVLDADDGRTLFAESAPVMPDCPTAPLIDGDRAYLFGTSAAVRFARDASGQLTCALVWNVPTDVQKRGSDSNHTMVENGGPDLFAMGAFPPVPVLHDGVLLTSVSEMTSIAHGPKTMSRVHAYDAATGTALAQVTPILENAMRPVSSMALAGSYLFAGDEGGPIAYAYKDFPQVPQVAVLLAAPRPIRLTVNPGLCSRAPPVFAGRRMFLAGSDQVVCCERPVAAGSRFTPIEVRELLNRFVPREIGNLVPAGKAPVDIPALDRLPEGCQMPVSELGLAFPPRWLVAGPLPQATPVDPFSALSGNQGALICAGTGLNLGGKTAVFQDASATMIDFHRNVRDPMWFGAGVNRSGYAILPQQVFTPGNGGKAYFASVFFNRRPRTINVASLMGVSIYLGGIKTAGDVPVRLQRGFYPVLIELTHVRTPPGAAKTVNRTFIDRIFQVGVDPAVERAGYLERVIEHEPLLRRLAESAREAGIPALAVSNAIAHLDEHRARAEGGRP